MKFNFKSFILVFAFVIILFASGCSTGTSGNDLIKTAEEAQITISERQSEIYEGGDSTEKSSKKMAAVRTVQTMPYYYISILNIAGTTGGKTFDDNFQYLADIVQTADKNNIKLTLFFTPEWAGYISRNKATLSFIKDWKESGHEISACHSSVYSIDWDGYSDLAGQDIQIIRTSVAESEMGYKGTFSDFLSELEKTGQDIKSACTIANLNMPPFPEEIKQHFKQEYYIGGGIIYYTFSKDDWLFFNENNSGIEEELNRYIISRELNGIKRKTLLHFQIDSKEDLSHSVNIIGSNGIDKVFGAAVQNNSKDIRFYYSLLDYLNEMDPEGLNSRTLSKIMEGGLLPEKDL